METQKDNYARREIWFMKDESSWKKWEKGRIRKENTNRLKNQERQNNTKKIP